MAHARSEMTHMSICTAGKAHVQYTIVRLTIEVMVTLQFCSSLDMSLIRFSLKKLRVALFYSSSPAFRLSIVTSSATRHLERYHSAPNIGA